MRCQRTKEGAALSGVTAGPKVSLGIFHSSFSCVLDLKGDRNLLFHFPQHRWVVLISLLSQRKKKAFFFPGPPSQPRSKWAAFSTTEYTGKNETLLRSLCTVVCVKTKHQRASCLGVRKVQVWVWLLYTQTLALSHRLWNEWRKIKHLNTHMQSYWVSATC